MTIVYTDAHRQHDPQFEIYDGERVAYAEQAGRAEAIRAALSARDFGPWVVPQRFNERYLRAIHQPAYIEFVRQRSTALAADDVLYPSYFMSDTYAPIVAGTYPAARAAANAALTGAQLLLAGEASAYSLCRPPGHHAAHTAMGGYCYFNNAAIAANYLSEHGRVAILDIDFHHGNGTQEAFYDRSDVLYVSLHANPQRRYPYSSGFAGETGRGNGQGFNVNIPLALTTNNSRYLRMLEAALQHVQDFNPDYLVVSAGFDTFQDDPIGGLSLTASVYEAIGEHIGNVRLPTLIVQEGGYNIDRLGELAGLFLTGFDRAHRQI
jgi:acetoin utilization deacetylase AcuC-like enzyme